MNQKLAILLLCNHILFSNTPSQEYLFFLPQLLPKFSPWHHKNPPHSCLSFHTFKHMQHSTQIWNTEYILQFLGNRLASSVSRSHPLEKIDKNVDPTSDTSILLIPLPSSPSMH